MKTCFSVCVPQGEEFEEGRLYKGDRTKTPSGCGGTSTRAVRPTSRVLSRPVVGTSGVSAKIVLPLTHMAESGRGRGPVLIPKGTLVQWVEQRLGLAMGHRFESDRFHVTLSRALHKTPVRSRRRAFFGDQNHDYAIRCTTCPQSFGRTRVDGTPGQSRGRVMRHGGLSLL